MTITKDQIKALNPCKKGWKWYLAHPITDMRELMAALADDSHANWAFWLATKLMTKAKCVEFAIFAAERVLPIWEARYSNDHRPREAIQAARVWLEDQSDSNEAYAAADAAYTAAADADNTAYTANAAFSAASAAYTAYTAYTADYATNAAAYAADAIIAVGRKAAFAEQLIEKAIRILEAR